MKKVVIVILASLTMMLGCSKQEDPEAVVAQEDPAPIESPQQQIEQDTVETTTPSVNLGYTLAATQQQANALMDNTKQAAMTAASSVDWANLSWNEVSKVPFDDKDKLLEWAAPQINRLKDQLGKAAIQQGQISLANLGDSGWQGTVKDVLAALDGVRRSSPETWNSARNALMMAWEALQQEASKMLGEG